MFDITLALPCIYTDQISRIYSEIENNLGPVDSKTHTDIKWELIVISPSKIDTPLKDKTNLTLIQDYGNPSRCVHLASTIARGTLFTWLSDDCSIINNNLEFLIRDFLSHGNEINEYVVRYLEFGPNGECGSQSDRYWTTGAHGALDKLRGLSRMKVIAPVGILYTDYFRKIGGFDCKFMHINMSCIDLSLRIQNLGGQVILPNYSIYQCKQGQNGEFLGEIFEKYDKLYFWSIYDDIEKASNRKIIDYNRWMVDAEPIWEQRFGKFKESH